LWRRRHTDRTDRTDHHGGLDALRAAIDHAMRAAAAAAAATPAPAPIRETSRSSAPARPGNDVAVARGHSAHSDTTTELRHIQDGNGAAIFTARSGKPTSR